VKIYNEGYKCIIRRYKQACESENNRMIEFSLKVEKKKFVGTSNITVLLYFIKDQNHSILIASKFIYQCIFNI